MTKHNIRRKTGSLRGDAEVDHRTSLSEHLATKEKGWLYVACRKRAATTATKKSMSKANSRRRKFLFNEVLEGESFEKGVRQRKGG